MNLTVVMRTEKSPLDKSAAKKIDMVLPIILLSYFLLLLDNTIVFTGTVKIAQELHLTPNTLSWVTNAYAITFGGLLLCGGRLGDIIGRKMIFSIGLVLFGLGSLLVGSAQSAASIICARSFQGIGAAVMAPTTLALIMDNYQGEARTKAIAAYGATAGIGTSIGLVVGGVFASFFTWRDGFFVNIPIIIIMLILTKKYIKESATERGRIDYIGVVTSVIGMAALVYSIIGQIYKLPALALAVIFLSVFIIQERMSKTPIMPLRIFKDRMRLGAYISRFFYLGAMLGLWFLTPQMLQRVLGFTPLEAGVAVFPFTIINFITALQVPRLTKKWGNIRLLITGIIITTFGMILLSLFKAEMGYWLGVALPMLFLGGGQGLSLSPLTAAAVSDVLPQDAGSASGVVNVVHQIGGSVGLSVIVALSVNVGGAIAAYNIQMTIAAALFITSLLAALILILPVAKKSTRTI